MYVVDRSARLIWWNKRFETVSGLPPEELMNRPAISFFPTEDQPLIAERILKVFEEGQAEAEAHFLTVAGPVSYHFNGVILRDDDGGIIGLTGVGRDISERKRSEEAAQRWTSLYESLFKAQSSLGEGIAITEGDRIVFANQALSGIYGYAPGELLAMPSFLDLVVPEGRRVLIERLRDDVSSGGHGETTILNKGGDRVDIEYSFTPVSIGGRTQLFAIIRDISQRKRDEGALRQSEERYRALVDTSPDAVVIHDGRHVIFANPAAAALGRLEGPSELIGRPMEDFVHPDYRQVVRERAIQIIQKREILPAMELKHIRGDGSLVDVEAKGARISMPDGTTAIQTVIRDISERKRDEEALRREALFVKLLQVVAVTANLEDSVEETLQIVIDQVCRYIGWPVGHVYMAGSKPSNDMIPTSIWHMESAEQFQTFRRITEATTLPPGVGLPGRVLATKMRYGYRTSA